MRRNSNGHCVQCGRQYEAPHVEDGLCSLCRSYEPQNDSLVYDEAIPRWKYSREAMRERLGATGNEDV